MLRYLPRGDKRSNDAGPPPPAASIAEHPPASSFSGRLAKPGPAPAALPPLETPLIPLPNRGMMAPPPNTAVLFLARAALHRAAPLPPRAASGGVPPRGVVLAGLEVVYEPSYWLKRGPGSLFEKYESVQG